MKQTFCRGRYIAALALCATWAVPAWAKKCPADSVQVGPACVDTYEASVWQITPSNTGLIRKVQKGIATLDDLVGGGAVQLGCTFAPFSQTAYPANFPNDGNWTPVLGSSPPSPAVKRSS